MALADYLTLIDYVAGCQHFISGLHISLCLQSLESKPNNLRLMLSSFFLEPCFIPFVNYIWLNLILLCFLYTFHTDGARLG